MNNAFPIEIDFFFFLRHNVVQVLHFVDCSEHSPKIFRIAIDNSKSIVGSREESRAFLIEAYSARVHCIIRTLGITTRSRIVPPPRFSVLPMRYRQRFSRRFESAGPGKDWRGALSSPGRSVYLEHCRFAMNKQQSGFFETI